MVSINDFFKEIGWQITWLKVSVSTNKEVVAILVAILVCVHWTKPILKLGREIDKRT